MAALAIIGTFGVLHDATATVRLADDWEKNPPCVGGPRTPQELLDVQQGRRPPGVCPLSEPSRLRQATEKLADSLKATPMGEHELQTGYAPGFKLFIDDVKYYIDSAIFMARERPSEVCTPKHFDNIPTYLCEEGQRLTKHPHIFFFNEQLATVGAYRLHLNLPNPYYCNAMPSMGTGDKARNEILVTVQCFNINTKPAKSIKDVGSDWQRMTVLFRVKAADGKVVLEQDDTCLGNPNTYEDVPTARKALKQCAARK